MLEDGYAPPWQGFFSGGREEGWREGAGNIPSGSELLLLVPARVIAKETVVFSILTEKNTKQEVHSLHFRELGILPWRGYLALWWLVS